MEVLLGMLQAAPVDSWLLWADFDTVFSGRTFGLPLAQYEDEQRHLVLSGQLDKVLAGDGYSKSTSNDISTCTGSHHALPTTLEQFA